MSLDTADLLQLTSIVYKDVKINVQVNNNSNSDADADKYVA